MSLHARRALLSRTDALVQGSRAGAATRGWWRCHARGAAALISIACMGACGGSGGDAPTAPTPGTGGASGAGNAAVATVTVTSPGSSVIVGQRIALVAVLKDAAGNALSGRTITWHSSDTTELTVATDGVATAIAPGAPVVTATSEGQSGSTSITIVPAPVASITLTLNSTTLAIGETTHAVVVLKDANGATLGGRTITYVSTAPDVARVDTSGVVTAVGSGSATITATSETKSASVTVTVTGTRALVDRADDVAGSQIHVIYALPSDGTDRSLDINGTLASSVGSWQAWLATQTGGRKLRLDTYDGAIDVTFVRLPRSNAVMSSYGVFIRDTLEKDLAALGFNAPNKIYAVYFDGGSGDATASCGGGAWPPALPGRVAAMYLQATPQGAPACNTNAFAASSAAAPGYLEYGMLHEIMHTLGFVASNAPHAALSGHVSDSNTDLMYAGTLPWQPSVLDVGKDDYFGPNVPGGVLNLASSSFLLP